MDRGSEESVEATLDQDRKFQEIFGTSKAELRANGIDPDIYMSEHIPSGSRVLRTVFIGEGEPPPRPSAPPVAQFLELIPVADPDREVPFGGRLQILGIERYDTKVAVAWRMAPLPDSELQYADEIRRHERDTEGLPEDERKMLRLRFLHQLDRGRYDFSLADDLGTEYLRTGGGSGGSREEQTGRAQFMPGVPKAASMLKVRWNDLTFQVSIGGHE